MITSDGGSSCDSATLLDGRGTGELHTPNLVDHACADGSAGSYHVDESLDRLKVSTGDGFALSAGETVQP